MSFFVLIIRLILFQKTYTVGFLTKKRVQNKGKVPQYYVEESHTAIIDKGMWEAIIS